MKKSLIFIFLLLSSFTFAAEPLMLINPFRETILHFPSAILAKENLVVTIFLPEAAVPLTQKYPTVYMLGVGPEQAEQIKKLQDSSAQKALLVGVSLGENASAETEQIAAFIARELVPYITANYLTIDDPVFRALALAGPDKAPLAVELLKKKDLFARLIFSAPGEKPVSVAGANGQLRSLFIGKRKELLTWQETLEDMSYTYGTNFVTKIAEEAKIEEMLDLDYLFAQVRAVRIRKLTGALFPKAIRLQEGGSYLSLKAVLNNGAVFDYIPLSVRMSPPYLAWNAVAGVLSPVSGAEAGQVNLSVSVDNVKFATKIQLKK